ncbi:hypothetical protein DSECCO2_380310 [anaerobic digester metagenome]
MAGGDRRDVAVRDDDRAPPGREDPPDLCKRSVVEPVHALCLDPDRLAVGQIGHDRIEGVVADRDRRGVGDHHIRAREVLPVAGDHRGVKVAPEYPDADLPGLKEDTAGAAERIVDPLPGRNEGEVDERAGHPGHHHPGVEERPAHGVPHLERPPVDTRDDPAEVAAVFGGDGAVLLDRVTERDRADDECPDQPLQVKLRRLHPAPLDLLHPAGKRSIGPNGEVAEEFRERFLCGLALPEVLHHHVRQGKPADSSRIRALGDRDLGPPVEDGSRALQFRGREVGVFAGELEEQFHPEDIGPAGG